jgi:hypothetical protein
MILGNRVRVEINRYHIDKYHGRIATGQEIGIFTRKSMFRPWHLESGNLGVMIEGEKFNWFSLKLGRYDPYGHFTVSVILWDEYHD